MGKKIEDGTLAILSRVTIEGNTVFLTCGQLDRKQYQSVNKVLENMGGSWNTKAKGHIFSSDPNDALEQVLLTGEITPPQKFGYFPTPPELAKHVVALADISKEHEVLEPSAGQAGIADELPARDKVVCVELLPENTRVLKEKGYRVIEGCFLALQPDQTFHRITMNPPFEKQADIDHVQHAWRFLKPGGRLVAIMSAGVAFRENKKTTAFRDLLNAHGYMEHNSPGAFKASGTMVNTVTVVLNKPH